MKSAIEQIFMGQRGDGQKIKPTQKYWESFKKFSAEYDKLAAELNEEQKQWLENIYNFVCEMEEEAEFSHYREGVKIGILLGVEAGGD